MNTVYKRFSSINAMQSFARNQTDMEVIDFGIYSDNNGLTFRPQVFLAAKDGCGEMVLRFNAYCDDSVDFFKRTEARNCAKNIAREM